MSSQEPVERKTGGSVAKLRTRAERMLAAWDVYDHEVEMAAWREENKGREYEDWSCSPAPKSSIGFMGVAPATLLKLLAVVEALTEEWDRSDDSRPREVGTKLYTTPEMVAALEALNE